MTTANESCESTGQMSLFGETCESSTVGLLPTPQAQLAKHAAPTEWEQEHRPNHLHVMALTSSPQGIPASHSHSPGSDWARRMTATYGRKFGAYWLSCDPPDSWVRTLLGTSTWASMTCYLTWKKSATPHGRLLFRLVPSTPRTAGIGSGLWPTPNVAGGGNNCELTPHKGHFLRPSGEKAHLGLDQAARMWPTPRAEFDSGRHRGEPDTLHPAVKLWGTPTSRDHKDTGNMENVPVNGLLDRQVAEPGLKLNSAWVSRMMGYPDGWLILDGEATP